MNFPSRGSGPHRLLSWVLSSVSTSPHGGDTHSYRVLLAVWPIGVFQLVSCPLLHQVLLKDKPYKLLKDSSFRLGLPNAELWGPSLEESLIAGHLTTPGRLLLSVFIVSDLGLASCSLGWPGHLFFLRP